MKRRLSSWKGRLLSMAGRICMIKSVLSSIPLFYLSLFKMPVGVANEIVNIQRNFLWGWGSDRRKVVWDSWKKVCEAREDRGFGILDLRIFNSALLGKWIWCLGSDKGGLWKEVLVSKYGYWRNLRAGRGGSSDSLWWKDLREVWSLKGWGQNFEDVVARKMGNGNEVIFWEDN